MLGNFVGDVLEPLVVNVILNLYRTLWERNISYLFALLERGAQRSLYSSLYNT